MGICDIPFGSDICLTASEMPCGTWGIYIISRLFAKQTYRFSRMGNISLSHSENIAKKTTRKRVSFFLLRVVSFYTRKQSVRQIFFSLYKKSSVSFVFLFYTAPHYAMPYLFIRCKKEIYSPISLKKSIL